MVEVFKTNVQMRSDAKMLIDIIQSTFIGSVANFDLEDCDRILRITSSGRIQSAAVIGLLVRLGFDAFILPDEKPGNVQIMLFDKKFYPVF